MDNLFTRNCRRTSTDGARLNDSRFISPALAISGLPPQAGSRKIAIGSSLAMIHGSTCGHAQKGDSAMSLMMLPSLGDASVRLEAAPPPF
jgi:hypothetical protein